MSDQSDDTNHLLLIPPDFFMADLANISSASDGVGSSVSKHGFHAPRSANPLPIPSKFVQPLATKTADSSFRSYQAAATNGRPSMLHHSTPKCAQSEPPISADRQVIGEIDRFLGQVAQRKLSPEETLREFRAQRSAESTGGLHRSLAGGRSLFQGQTVGNGATVAATEEPLLSLSSMWGMDERRQPDAGQSLHEERMRRAHCEQTIHQLQQTLLERDQKITIALRVDRRKDDALGQLRANLAAEQSATAAAQQSLDRAVQRFAAEHQLIDGQCAQLRADNERLQRELQQSQTAQRHLHECNELLEQKIAHVSRSTADVRVMHQQQIAELEVRLKNSASTEERCAAELKELRAKTDAERVMWERSAAAAEQASRAWLDRERALMDELSEQRAALKSFYQAQLNEAVARKLADFQQQVDGVEEAVRAEGRQRERLIGERAMRLEQIVQKNEQECALLTEKYQAEIDLYRIQLHNSAKTIDALQQTVHALREKRTDMAERLHSVMETQWQRALEIIASPTSKQPATKANATEMRSSSADGNAGRRESIESLHTKAESDSAGPTPTTVRQRASPECSGNINSDGREHDPVQHYIQMLLEKSPGADADAANKFSERMNGQVQAKGEMGAPDDQQQRRSRKPWK